MQVKPYPPPHTHPITPPTRRLLSFSDILAKRTENGTSATSASSLLAAAAIAASTAAATAAEADAEGGGGRPLLGVSRAPPLFRAASAGVAAWDVM